MAMTFGPDVKVEHWDGSTPALAVAALEGGGGLVVAATKVGYILMATDGAGLERKFDAKQRRRNKPGVVLCSSLEQLETLAQMTPQVRELYQAHWDDDILLGCILPWRNDADQYLPDDISRDLARDVRATSCFVIRFGRPAESVVEELWKSRRTLTFASSANPSGVGNRGRLDGIGERIAQSVDAVVEADKYVKSIQPTKDEASRHEQGVMVSMVDEDGNLVGEPGSRAESLPTLIRKGLDYDRVMVHLSDLYDSWDYRQGMYY